jgi:hypothetical protein
MQSVEHPLDFIRAEASKLSTYISVSRNSFSLKNTVTIIENLKETRKYKHLELVSFANRNICEYTKISIERVIMREVLERV